MDGHPFVEADESGDTTPTTVELAFTRLSTMGISLEKALDALEKIVRAGDSVSKMDDNDLVQQLIDQLESDEQLKPSNEEVFLPIHSPSHRPVTVGVQGDRPLAVRVAPRAGVSRASSRCQPPPETCVICLDPMWPRDEDSAVLPCAHKFHQECIQNYMRIHVKEHMAVPPHNRPDTFKCPIPECDQKILRDVLQRHVSGSTVQRYDDRCQEYEVDQNPNKCFCKNCNHVVELSATARVCPVVVTVAFVALTLLFAAAAGFCCSYFYKVPAWPLSIAGVLGVSMWLVLSKVKRALARRLPFASDALSVLQGFRVERDWGWPVVCSHCKVIFCFHCKALGHAGSPCAGWKIPNTKGCPRCKRPIEKVLRSEGGACNHITCHCGHEFCWLCMHPYTPSHFEFGACRQYGGDAETLIVGTRLSALAIAFAYVFLGPFVRDLCARPFVGPTRMLIMSALVLSGYSASLLAIDSARVHARWYAMTVGTSILFVVALVQTCLGIAPAALWISWYTNVEHVDLAASAFGFWMVAASCTLGFLCRREYYHASRTFSCAILHVCLSLVADWLAEIVPQCAGAVSMLACSVAVITTVGSDVFLSELRRAPGAQSMANIAQILATFGLMADLGLKPEHIGNAAAVWFCGIAIVESMLFVPVVFSLFERLAPSLSQSLSHTILEPIFMLFHRVRDWPLPVPLLFFWHMRVWQEVVGQIAGVSFTDALVSLMVTLGLFLAMWAFAIACCVQSCQFFCETYRRRYSNHQREFANFFLFSLGIAIVVLLVVFGVLAFGGAVGYALAFESATSVMIATSAAVVVAEHFQSSSWFGILPVIGVFCFGVGYLTLKIDLLVEKSVACFFLGTCGTKLLCDWLDAHWPNRYLDLLLR